MRQQYLFLIVLLHVTGFSCARGVTPDTIDEVVLYSWHEAPEVQRQRTIERLVKQSVSTQPAIRESAEWRLMDLGEPVLPYVKSMIRSGDEREQEIGLNFMARFHRPDLMHFYRQFIDVTAYPPIRMLCLRNIEPYRDTAALEMVMSLTGHESAGMRLEAIRVLKSWGDSAVVARQAVPALLGLLNDPDTAVRASALEAMEKMGDAGTVPYLVDHGRRILDHRLGAEKEALAVALGKFRDSRAVPLLKKMLLDANSAAVRRLSAEALGLIGDGSAVPVLIRVLDDSSPEVFRASCAALKQLTGVDLTAEGETLSEIQVKTKRAWQRWWKRRAV